MPDGVPGPIPGCVVPLSTLAYELDNGRLWLQVADSKAVSDSCDLDGPVLGTSHRRAILNLFADQLADNSPRAEVWAGGEAIPGRRPRRHALPATRNLIRRALSPANIRRPARFEPLTCDYHRCGLARRWPSLTTRLERTWRMAGRHG